MITLHYTTGKNLGFLKGPKKENLGYLVCAEFRIIAEEAQFLRGRCGKGFPSRGLGLHLDNLCKSPYLGVT